MSLLRAWLDAKEAEAAARDKRREIEDKILADNDGAKSITDGEITLRVTTRENKKIDGDLLQELAREAGLTAHLGALFRWKPEINKAVWDAADEKITRPLLGAITTTPGRPTLSVIKEKGQK